jgi:hypothetical protein
MAEPHAGSQSAGHTDIHLVWIWILGNREICSNIVIGMLVIAGAAVAWVVGPIVTPIPGAPLGMPCQQVGGMTRTGLAVSRDKVSNATGTLIISVGRAGYEERRESSPLAVQIGKGRFAGGTISCTTASDFVRSDGQVLPADQVTSEALVTNNGDAVIVRVSVAPRYGQVSGFGSYSGTVSLDDSRASGANVLVRIDVEYPYVNRVLLCGLLLACAGLIWGLLVRIADKDLPSQDRNEPFFANLALRVAVLATAVPIVNAQVLSNPSWTGSLSQYIRLGGLVGAAAIAATPSLRALVSRLPSASEGS